MQQFEEPEETSPCWGASSRLDPSSPRDRLERRAALCDRARPRKSQPICIVSRVGQAGEAVGMGISAPDMLSSRTHTPLLPFTQAERRCRLALLPSFRTSSAAHRTIADFELLTIRGRKGSINLSLSLVPGYPCHVLALSTREVDPRENKNSSK